MIYNLTHIRKGRVLRQWSEKNLFTNVGVNNYVANALQSSGVGQFAGFMLLDAPLDPLPPNDPNPSLFALDQTDTVFSHPGWLEVVTYTANNGANVRPIAREVPPPSSPSYTATPDDPDIPASGNNGIFKITGNVSAMGIGIAQGTIKLAGDPLSLASFTNGRIDFIAGDLLIVTYTITTAGGSGSAYPIAFSAM